MDAQELLDAAQSQALAPRSTALYSVSREGARMNKPACDSGVWPCRYTACPYCLASVASRELPGASWCMQVVWRLGESGPTLADIGAELGLVHERVRQLESSALHKAREAWAGSATNAKLSKARSCGHHRRKHRAGTEGEKSSPLPRALERGR